ncbi:MAG: hypothetical protein R6U98_26060 [Pirellulaceae bacterium]
MESCPTQAVLPLVGVAPEKVSPDRYSYGKIVFPDMGILRLAFGWEPLPWRGWWHGIGGASSATRPFAEPAVFIESPVITEATQLRG